MDVQFSCFVIFLLCLLCVWICNYVRIIYGVYMDFVYCHFPTMPMHSKRRRNHNATTFMLIVIIVNNYVFNVHYNMDCLIVYGY